MASLGIVTVLKPSLGYKQCAEIAREGYEAMSMRQLAAKVGVQPAALYRYFPNKEDLLFSLMRDHMGDLLKAWQAHEPATGDPVVRLASYVENHIAFHIARRHSTHVSNMELRSLSRENLTHMLKLRSTYEKELRTILRDGSETGAFDMDDVGLTAMALIQMMTGVIVWFRPDERLSVAGVTATYLGMTMRLVGAKAGAVEERSGEDHNVHAHA